MKRHSKTGGKTAEGPSRNKLKRKVSSQQASRRASSAGGKAPDIVPLTRERDEALEQQAATDEVLRLISSSPDGLHAVFASILQNAVRICAANFGYIYRWDDRTLRRVANHNSPRAFVEERKSSENIPPHPDSLMAQMLATKIFVHVKDLSQHPSTRKTRTGNSGRS
jgi:hypothetical protein